MNQQAIDILDDLDKKLDLKETTPNYVRWYRKALEKAKSRIQALPDNDWIPVTEILPDGKWNVIIFADTFVSEWYYYPIHNCWYRNENDVKPTHWMPLPLPPNK